MTDEQYYTLIHPYQDAMNLILTRLKILNHTAYENEDFQPIHSITNRIKEKESIENKLYSWDEDVASNAVEVHIHHLRKKLGKDIVKTINKIGYTLED